MSKKKKGKNTNSKAAKASSRSVKSGKKSADRSLLIGLGAILAIFAFLIYTNTLSHDYALDDYSAIKENYVTKKGLGGLKEIFTRHYRYGYWNSPGTLYRPMSLAMFAVEWEIAEDSPGFYHFVNVLLYALTAFLLFWTLCKLLRDRGPLIPFLVTLIFVSHPIHVEVVANIKSRDEILAFLFSVLAIYGFWKYISYKDLKWLLLALLFYTISMFSKESAITFLAVFPLVAYFFIKKETSKAVITSALFLVPASIYLLVRKQVLGSISAGSTDISALDNVLAQASGKGEELSTAFMLGGKYLKNLVFPHPLGSDFGYPQYTIVDWGDWRVLLSLLIFIGMGIWAVLNLKKKNLLAFGILYFLITFSIFSNMIIKIGTSYGDRLMYAPSLGYAIVLAVLVVQLTKSEMDNKARNFKTFFKQYKTPVLIVGLIALAYAVKTYTRNTVWENSYSLYEADIKIAPNSAKLNYHYGLELNKIGIAATDDAKRKEYWDKALAQFNRAIELTPDYSDAYGQRGLLFYRGKNFEQAIKDYEKSIALKPNSKVYSNMGTIYFETGRIADAINAYKNAIKYDPRFVDARRNLGSAYAMSKQYDLALREYQEALKYDPNNATITLYIGTVYRDMGDTANAKIWLEKAYQLDPGLRK